MDWRKRQECGFFVLFGGLTVMIVLLMRAGFKAAVETHEERANRLQREVNELRVRHEGYVWVDGAPNPVMPRPRRKAVER